ncbi:MAG: 2-oxoglutarate dehydrogenase complex dihydrolipoyllysine-residue succinyltransferase [Bacteroidales bacterium]
MALEIKIPSPGESITEVEMASWFVEDGDLVSKNQELGEIESEKATLPLIAEKSGKIKILVKEGETVKVGQVVASIDTDVEVPDTASATEDKESETGSGSRKEVEPEPAKATKKAATAGEDSATREAGYEAVKVTPVARQIMEKEGLSVEDVINGLKKLTADNVRQVMQGQGPSPSLLQTQEASREEERNKVSQLRKKISQRLVAVKNETAMLTTFNEADMSAIMRIRKQNQDQFVEKYGIKLGFMSFFTKAVTESLKLFPAVNSYLENDEIISPKYCDIGIAVQTDKGLMVPIIRNAEILSLAELEQQIAELAAKARKARLSIEEMSGGTFTISNGGIYGSMLSTPILNPPQSGILGMHNIIERPMAVNGKVEIRPMMYLALSYDHRVIDGKDSVSFLKSVKTFIEDPSRMIFSDRSSEQFLLGI